MNGARKEKASASQPKKTNYKS